MTKDRFGDDVDSDVPPPHDRRCQGGWLDRDADTPVPCLESKPHLDPALRRRALLDADHLRATRPPEGEDR